MDNSKKKINYSVELNNIKTNNQINLDKKRYKYTNKELDFTIIEILKEDNISDFLILNIIKMSKYFLIQYPGGKNLKISISKSLNKKK